jgi:hypothetical protein
MGLKMFLLNLMSEEGGDGQNGGGAPATTAPAGSVLANVAAQHEQQNQQQQDPSAWLPEKFRVKGADDALDVGASAQKMAEAYKHMETRLGSGDAPPKSPDEYDVKSDKFDFAEFKADEANQAFLKSAHAKGLTNAQVEFVLGEYFERAPALVAGAGQLDAAATIEAVRQEWGDKTDANLGLAVKAAMAAGFTLNQIKTSTDFNSPTLLKMAAFFGAQLGEDQPPSGGGVSAESLQDMLASEAYNNPKHPDHRRVYEQVAKHYERMHKQ